MSFLRRFILFDILVVVLCGILAFYFFDSLMKPHTSSSSQSDVVPNVSYSPVPTSRVWQLMLSFDTQKQQLSLTNITIKPGSANASPYHNSPYQLLVLDKNNKTLFATDITISEQILYDVYFPGGATPSALPSLDQLNSIVAIPYFAEAQTIQITKNNQSILSVTPPKEVSFALPKVVQQSYAATCSLLHVVFVSEGYSDIAKFHIDVQKAETAFLSKAPFSSHQNIFDFKTVDNPATNQLGCEKDQALNVNCLYNNSILKIADVVYKVYPQLPFDSTYTKIVVVVDGSPQSINQGRGLILGVASSIGGQFGVFQNQQFFETAATMEILGHDVGQLYDRYLYPPAPNSASEFGNKIRAPFQSNCTTNSQGEAFWKNAGVTQAYKGCTSQYLYAPAPLDCANGQGSSKTIMSAAGCAGPQFDGVEQYYINSVILPKYLCALSPTPAPTMPPTPSTGSGSSTSSSSASGSTPVQTVPNGYKGFDCQPDPSCIANKNLQLCALKCVPK